MNTTLQIRIDSNDKIQAQKIFKKMGMDLSSGIKTFVRQVITDKAMPFQARTENGYTPEFEKQLIKDSQWMKKHGKSFKNVDELFSYLKK